MTGLASLYKGWTYQTVAFVNIQDGRLAFIHYLLMGLICFYIGVVQIIGSNQFTLLETPQGTVRMQLQGPVKDQYVWYFPWLRSHDLSGATRTTLTVSMISLRRRLWGTAALMGYCCAALSRSLLKVCF